MDAILQLSHDKMIVLFLFGGGIVIGGLIGLAAVVSHFVCKYRAIERESLLKMEMIQRGLSAEEIAKVLNARKLEDEEYFKLWLVEKGLSGQDISKVVNAGWWEKLMK